MDERIARIGFWRRLRWIVPCYLPVCISSFESDRETKEIEMATCVTDWMRLRCGIRIHRKDNPHHVGRIEAIHHGAFVRVKWDVSGWIEDDVPLAELVRVRAPWEAGER